MQNDSKKLQVAPAYNRVSPELPEGKGGYKIIFSETFSLSDGKLPVLCNAIQLKTIELEPEHRTGINHT